MEPQVPLHVQAIIPARVQLHVVPVIMVIHNVPEPVVTKHVPQVHGGVQLRVQHQQMAVQPAVLVNVALVVMKVTVPAALHVWTNYQIRIIVEHVAMSVPVVRHVLRESV